MKTTYFDVIAEHLFLSEDGNLYDTRREAWPMYPLRKDYRKTYSTIRTVSQLKATLRAGGYAWPGGYPLFFITSDCEALSFEAVFKEYKQCINSLKHGLNDGWRIVSCGINWEDETLYCSHTDKLIPCAYPSK